MVKVKICGITTLADALYAAELGADFLGFNFYPSSPRFIRLNDAYYLVRVLRSELGANCPVLAGVFVNEVPHVVATTCMLVGLDFAQLSGDEPKEYLMRFRALAVKAIRPKNLDDALDSIDCYGLYASINEQLPSLIVDAYHPQLYGGTGEQISVELVHAVKTRTHRMMLAGGLTPDNISPRVAAVQPWGVDVASGVENGVAGRKDAAKVRDFIEAVRGAV